MLLLLRYSFIMFFFTTLLPITPSYIVSGTTLDHAIFALPSTGTKIAIKNQSFTNNASRGSKITGISDFKRYLYRFGYYYLSKQNNTNFTDEFDGRFELALIRYQQRFGLEVTGKLDSNTVSQIITPRCGVPDTTTTHRNHHHHHHHHIMHSTKHFVYFPGKPRWSRPMPMTLTYAFSPVNMIHSLSLRDIREAFQRAFLKWASVIPVSFVETQDYGYAEIKIGFYSGDHGDGEPFDGVLGVLAHSFSPESGRLHLDAAETWAVDFRVTKSEVAVDLESVATHEIGHLLGLSHSSVKEAVMYPSLRPRDKRADLNIDDIKGVQSLYGSNPNFRSEGLLESDLSSNRGAELIGVKPLKLAAGFILSSIIHTLLCASL